nr:hypothetical transcript [Hymenolepis microstoma]
MNQYTLSHVHSGKCKKEAKLDAQMSKELQKAAKAKPQQILCKITPEKVLFKNKKEVIIRQNITKTRKNKENKIIVLATKTEKKNLKHIYALKFTDEDNFNRFSEAISAEPKDSTDKKQTPRSNSPAKRPQSSAAKHEEPHHYDNIDSLHKTPNRISRSESRGSSPVLTESSVRTNQSSRRSSTRTPSRMREMKPKRRPASSSSSSSSSSTSKVLAQRRRASGRNESPSTLPSTSTYITTDVLNSPKRAGDPQRDSMRMPLSEGYPARNGAQKHRSRAEVNYLNYVPGKGMVNSSEENIYQYSSRIRNASESLSPSSSNRSSSRSSNSSSSTSIPVNVSKARGINRSNSSRRSGVRRVSVTSSSSSTMRNQPNPKVNVWQYKDLGVDSTSSSSTDVSRDALQRPEARSQHYPAPELNKQFWNYIKFHSSTLP